MLGFRGSLFQPLPRFIGYSSIRHLSYFSPSPTSLFFPLATHPETSEFLDWVWLAAFCHSCVNECWTITSVLTWLELSRGVCWRSRLSGLWLKMQVVRPVSSSLQERESLLGSSFLLERVQHQLRSSEISWSSLFPRPKREVKHRWNVLVKVYTPGWNMHVGNESPWVVGVSRLLEKILPVVLCSFS
jgi:hypothetical protein